MRNGTKRPDWRHALLERLAVAAVGPRGANLNRSSVKAPEISWLSRKKLPQLRPQ